MPTATPEAHYQVAIASKATSPLPGLGLPAVSNGVTRVAHCSNPEVATLSINKEIDKKRTAILRSDSAHCVHRYHIGELDVLLQNAALLFPGREEELAALQKELELIEKGECLETVVRNRLEKRRALYESMLVKQLEETAAGSAQQRDTEAELHAEADMIDKEIAELEERLREASPPPATPKESEKEPRSSLSLEPLREIEWIIRTQADLKPAPASALFEQKRVSPWKALEKLKRLQDPFGEFAWKGATLRALFKDVQLVCTRHSNFAPWDVTIPIYAFTHTFNEELIWAMKNDSSGPRGWELCKDVRHFELSYRAHDERCVTLPNGDILAFAKETAGVDFFASKSPNNFDTHVLVARYCLSQRSIEGTAEAGYTCDPVLWLPNAPVDDIISCEADLPPSAVIEYIASRPYNETIDLRGTVQEDAAWSVAPLANAGIADMIHEAAALPTATFPKDDVFALFDTATVPTVGVSFERVLNLPQGLSCLRISSLQEDDNSVAEAGRVKDIYLTEVPFGDVFQLPLHGADSEGLRLVHKGFRGNTEGGDPWEQGSSSSRDEDNSSARFTPALGCGKGVSVEEEQRRLSASRCSVVGEMCLYEECERAFKQLQTEHLQFVLCYLPQNSDFAYDEVRECLEDVVSRSVEDATKDLSESERGAAFLLYPAPKVHILSSDTGPAYHIDVPVGSSSMARRNVITLFGLNSKGGQAGTAHTTVPEEDTEREGDSFRKTLLALLHNAAGNAWWDPSGIAPTMVYLTLPRGCDAHIAREAVNEFFGVKRPGHVFLYCQKTVVSTAQATILWVANALTVSQGLLSPFRHADSTEKANITMIDECSIVSINGQPAASVYDAWCGGSIGRYAEEAKASGCAAYFHTSEILFLEVSILVDAAPKTGAASGATAPSRRVVIAPIGVTPAGGLRTVERVVRGEVVPCFFNFQDLHNEVQRHIQQCRISPQDVQALFIQLPSALGVACEARTAKRLSAADETATNIAFPKQAERDLHLLRRAVPPHAKIFFSYSAGRLGHLDKASPTVVSALPEIALIGFRGNLNHSDGAGGNGCLSSGNRVFRYRPNVFKLQVLVAGKCLGEAVLRLSKNDLVNAAGEGCRVGVPLQSVTSQLLGGTLQCRLLAAEECSVEQTERDMNRSALLRSVVHRKGLLTRDGHITSPGVGDALRCQLLEYAPLKRTYLLALSGKIPVIADMTAMHDATEQDQFLQGTPCGIPKSAHICAACGLPNLHSTKDGYVVVESGVPQYAGALLCTRCYYATFVTELQRRSNPSCYQLSQMIADVVSHSAAGTLQKPPSLLHRVGHEVSEISFSSLTHEGQWGFSHKGNVVHSSDCRVQLFGTPLEALTPFIALLNTALWSLRVGARSSGHVSHRVIDVPHPSCGGAGVCEEGGLYRWAGITWSQVEGVACHMRKQRLFTISTSMRCGAGSQWARQARRHPVLFPFGAVFSVDSCDDGATAVTEVSQEQAKQILEKYEKANESDKA